VIRVQPERVRTVEVGFRTVPGSVAAPASLSWASTHGGDGLRRVPEEAVMITGDGNLVEVQVTVRYTIAQPHVFLFEVGDAEETLRGLTESILRETVASRPFQELLTVHRQSFQDEVLTRLEHRRKSLIGDGLGIKLDGLSLQDLHPPQEVVPAYYEVTQAMEARDRKVNQAHAEALYKERDAQAKAEQIVRSAQAARTETIHEAEAAQAVFLARQRSRSHLPATQEVELFLGVVQGALAKKKPEELTREWSERRRQRLEAQAVLTDFRLFWDAMGRSLAGREKLIVDADKVPGRRQILLFDPEMFRIPVPVLPMGDRTLPPRSELHERGP
jgi:Cu+-exporting ATPase